MKPALLIIMLVCITTAACTARAGGFGAGDPTVNATTMALDQGPGSQAIGSADSAPNNDNADTSSSARQVADQHMRLPAAPSTKTKSRRQSPAIPTDATIPAATSDDSSHARAASWQSLLPGSIQ